MRRLLLFFLLAVLAVANADAKWLKDGVSAIKSAGKASNIVRQITPKPRPMGGFSFSSFSKPQLPPEPFKFTLIEIIPHTDNINRNIKAMILKSVSDLINNDDDEHKTIGIPSCYLKSSKPINEDIANKYELYNVIIPEGHFDNNPRLLWDVAIYAKSCGDYEFANLCIKRIEPKPAARDLTMYSAEIADGE